MRIWYYFSKSFRRLYNLSIYLATYLPVCLPIYQSIYLPTYISVCLPISPSIYLSAYLPTYQVRLPIYLSIYLSVCLSVYLPTYPFIYLLTHLSIYLPNRLSIHPSTHTYINLPTLPPIYPSIHPSIYLQSPHVCAQNEGKQEQLAEELNQYSLNGLPQMPNLLSLGQKEYPDELFELESHWTHLIDAQHKV